MQRGEGDEQPATRWAMRALLALVLLPIWPLFGVVSIAKGLVYTRAWLRHGAWHIVQHGRIFSVNWRDRARASTSLDPRAVTAARWHRWVVVSAFARDEQVDALSLEPLGEETGALVMVASSADAAPLIESLQARGMLDAQPTRRWRVSPSGLALHELFAWTLWLAVACALLVWWADRR